MFFSSLARLISAGVILFPAYSSKAAVDNLSLPVSITFPVPLGMKLIANIQGSVSLGAIPQKVWYSRVVGEARIVGLISPAEIDFISGSDEVKPGLLSPGVMGLVDDDSIPDSGAEGEEFFVREFAFLSARLAGITPPDATASGGASPPVVLRMSYPSYVDFMGGNDEDTGVRFHLGAPTCALSSSTVPSRMAYCSRAPDFSRDRTLVGSEDSVERVYYDILYQKNPLSSQYDDGLWVIMGNDPVRRGIGDRRDGTYLSVKPGARSGFYEGRFEIYLKIV